MNTEDDQRLEKALKCKIIADAVIKKVKEAVKLSNKLREEADVCILEKNIEGAKKVKKQLIEVNQQLVFYRALLEEQSKILDSI